MANIKGNDQELTTPVRKNDKIIRRSEMPPNQAPSGWQFPPKPGYDVIDNRGPGEIKEVGDMADVIYPGGMTDADLGMDLSPNATNSLGHPAGSTDSDPHNASEWQHPAPAEKPGGSTNTPEVVERVAMTGCESDDMMDRFPNSKLGRHDNIPADER